MLYLLNTTWYKFLQLLFISCSPFLVYPQAVHPLQVKLQIVNPSCNAQYGLLSILVTGGSPPYVYWVNGQISTPSSNRLAGNYTVLVCDASNNCTQIATQIIEPQPLMLNYTLQLPMCLACLHQLQILPSGGTPSYHYYLNGASTSSINYLSPGNYLLKVEDQQGCTKEELIKITPQLKPGVIPQIKY